MFHTRKLPKYLKLYIMKIRYKASFNGPGVDIKPGDIEEVIAERAERLIGRQLAIAVDDSSEVTVVRAVIEKKDTVKKSKKKSKTLPMESKMKSITSPKIKSKTSSKIKPITSSNMKLKTLSKISKGSKGLVSDFR